MMLVENPRPARMSALVSTAGRGGSGGVPPKGTIAAPPPDDGNEQRAADAVDRALSCDWHTLRTMKAILKNYRRRITPWGVVYEKR